MKQTTAPSNLENAPGMPASPLPAWKHYELMRHVEDKIHQKLSSLSYQGHALGLRVDYAIYPESGMGEPEMREIGSLIADAIAQRDDMSTHAALAARVAAIAGRFPVPGLARPA